MLPRRCTKRQSGESLRQRVRGRLRFSAEQASTAFSRSCSFAFSSASQGRRSSSVQRRAGGHLGDVRRRMEFVGVEERAAETLGERLADGASCRSPETPITMTITAFRGSACPPNLARIIASSFLA